MRLSAKSSHLTCQLCFSLVLSERSLVPLHPIPATNPLAVELALDVRCDPQLCGVPEAVHLTGEVLGELG